MGIVACDTALSNGLMAEHEGSSHRLVAFEAGFVCSLKIGRSAAHDRIASMGLMTIGARDLPGQDRVRMGQREFAALIQMALEACFRRIVRVDDRMSRPIGIDMSAPWSVAGLAADVQVVIPLCDQFGVSRTAEGVNLLRMALGAGLRANVMRAHDLGRSKDGPIDRDAGNEKQTRGAEAGDHNGICRPAEIQLF